MEVAMLSPLNRSKTLPNMAITSYLHHLKHRILHQSNK